jgi:4-diphosphocytidyl-2-C-methyl-D-erythritol kinase
MEYAKTVSIKAYAKINLVLNVVGRQDNLHLIDSIMTPFDIYDTVKMEKRTDREIFVKYTNCENITNDTASKMAKLISKKYGLLGVNIEINKNIPIKAGLGGSSADAGAVARGMEKLFSLEKIPNELLLEVGSDVPYMYLGGDKRVQGVGEKVSSVNLPKLYKVLIVDGIGVDTKKSYENYDLFGGDNQDIEKFLININKFCATFTNSLQKGSQKLNSNIQKASDLLTECGFSSCMTGSGSGVFGIEYDKAQFENKLKKLIKKQPNLQFFIS